MDPTEMMEMCAFIFPDQLLKMKNSDDFNKEVAATSTATASTSPEPVPAPTLKPPDPVLTLLTPLPLEPPSPTTSDATTNNSPPDISGEKVPTLVPNSNNSNGSSSNGIESMESSPVKPASPVIVYAKKSSPFDIKPKPTPSPVTPTASSPSEVAQKQPEPSTSTTPASSKPLEEAPSTSTMAPNPTSSVNNPSTILNNNISSTTSVTSANDEEDAMTVDSSSDEDDDIYVNQFSRDNIGSDNNEPAEELVIKRNSEYLVHRCASLMRRLQGIMQGTASRHVSKQLKSVLEFPGFSSASRTNNFPGRHHSFQDSAAAASQRLTKQSIAEMQFGGKVMTNIIRHSMGRQLNPNDDSATEESDTDDDEVVLPDERMMDLPSNNSSDYAPYLPVENNPFIEAIKVEKQYEARGTSLDFSINECEYSLTKSLALRKHCKARKPLFQLEKPSTSSNVINIPVDAASSTSGEVSKKGTQLARSNSSSTSSLDVSCRVSDMMTSQRSSLEKGKEKLSNGDGGNDLPVDGGLATQSTPTNGEPMIQGSSESGNRFAKASQENSTNANNGGNENSRQFPSTTIKQMGSDGHSMLGVEFLNHCDPNQSSSRCSAIKRPDKNRKVFQLGGIHNIFRDPSRLPTLRCTCFGRDELCALCLGRAKRKSEINHVHMSYKDKLAVLDETFHKTLSFPEDVPLDVLLASSAVGNNVPLTQPTSSIQQLIKARSHQFPPDVLETGPRPKKPRSYDIKPYVETPVRSPRKDGRYGDDLTQSPRKRPPPRKSQSSFEEKEFHEMAGKGLGWPGRERKDSIRRTRNQEFDIDNIVIPYSMAATTRVEQLVYKPIETPRWRIMDYAEIFSSDEKLEGELEDMTNTTFLHRHNKCEIEEKKRFSQSLQKALNATRKTRRLDSTCRSESDGMGLSGNVADENSSSANQLTCPDKLREMGTPLGNANSTQQGMEEKGTTTPVTDTSTVITEAMANQALKSLFKVGSRRRTVSTSNKVPLLPEEEEEAPPAVFVDPWPQRKFPLKDEEYKEMVENMEQCYLENEMDYTPHHNNLSHLDDPPSSPIFL